jgi:ABC-type transport system involved in multi-copper enzyme maturation permease subunit
MNLFRMFLAHELITQWRSMRFRALAAVYVIATSIPAVMAFLISGRTPRAIGPAATNTFLLSEQPLLTALLAAGLAVDALSRERDEGSFGVLSVAPISSAGYVLRRWLAIVTICMPISLMPTIISAALAIHTRQTLALLPMFAEGWLLSVLPSLLVSSALAIALGTITGRAVLSIIFAALLFTIGLDTMNDVLFRILRLNFGGPGDLFAGGERGIRELMWAIRFYWFPDMPSDAAFLLRTRSRTLLSRAGITAAMTMVLLALSAFYLRRTRRDLRPWKIPETHQLRTLIRTVNRIREEYAPDSGSSTPDRIMLVIALSLAALLTGNIIHRQSAFAALAGDRYAAETGHGVPTSTSVVAESARIDGEIRIDGALRGSATTVIRNAGDRAETHLSFALNPNVSVQRLRVDAGVAQVHRVWERVDVELDPPLAPRQSRTLSFDVAGLPGEIDFALQRPGNFREQWNRYRTAKLSMFMTDLSRSTIMPAATEVRMHLRASDIVPVLRYSEWTLLPDNQGEGFIPETITPNTALDVRLRHPYPIAVDSCGVIAARGEIVSRCTAPLASYLVFGGPLTQRNISPSATLVYIPAHEWLAQSHAQSLASSVRLASEAWPQLALPPHLVFIERPTEPGDRDWYNEFQPWRTVDQIGSRGAVFFVPEAIFTTTKPINTNVFAASIIAGTLRGKRRVVAEESSFFTHFYSSIAIGRLGLRKTRAVEPGAGFPPETAPLMNRMYFPENRMSKVLAGLEYRVGANHFVEGINDFVHAGDRPGNAKELINAIGRRGGLDLTRTYEDYFVGNALPELTLADVTFHRVGPRWEVTGAVKNNATGEAFVPIALRTSQGSLWQTIRVDSGGRATFSFSATGEPHSLQLDPDHVCYRHAAIGLVENVEYRGES